MLLSKNKQKTKITANSRDQDAPFILNVLRKKQNEGFWLGVGGRALSTLPRAEFLPDCRKQAGPNDAWGSRRRGHPRMPGERINQSEYCTLTKSIALTSEFR